MTKKQIAEYLKNPYNCPFCGSGSLDAIDYGFEGTLGTEPFIWNKLSCLCGKKWKEVYTLKTIEEVDED